MIPKPPTASTRLWAFRPFQTLAKRVTISLWVTCNSSTHNFPQKLYTVVTPFPDRPGPIASGGWSGLPTLGRASTHGTRSLKNHSMKLANQMKIKTIICSQYIKPNYINLNSMSYLYAYPSLIKLDGSQFTLASITLTSAAGRPGCPPIHIDVQYVYTNNISIYTYTHPNIGRPNPGHATLFLCRSLKAGTAGASIVSVSLTFKRTSHSLYMILYNTVSTIPQTLL